MVIREGPSKAAGEKGPGCPAGRLRDREGLRDYLTAGARGLRTAVGRWLCITLAGCVLQKPWA